MVLVGFTDRNRRKDYLKLLLIRRKLVPFTCVYMGGVGMMVVDGILKEKEQTRNKKDYTIRVFESHIS